MKKGDEEGIETGDHSGSVAVKIPPQDAPRMMMGARATQTLWADFSTIMRLNFPFFLLSSGKFGRNDVDCISLS
jgi:hypothetical protein